MMRQELTKAAETVESGNAISRSDEEKLTAAVAFELAHGNTLKAIDLLRQVQGLSPEQAKAIAEEAARKAHLSGTVRRSGNGGLFVFALLILLSAIAWLVFSKA